MKTRRQIRSALTWGNLAKLALKGWGSLVGPLWKKALLVAILALVAWLLLHRFSCDMFQGHSSTPVPQGGTVDVNGDHATVHTPGKPDHHIPIYAGGAHVTPGTPSAPASIRVPQVGIKWGGCLKRFDLSFVAAEREWRPALGVGVAYFRRIELKGVLNDHRIGAGPCVRWRNLSLGGGGQISLPKLKDWKTAAGFYGALSFHPF